MFAVIKSTNQYPESVKLFKVKEQAVNHSVEHIRKTNGGCSMGEYVRTTLEEYEHFCIDETTTLFIMETE